MRRGDGHFSKTIYQCSLRGEILLISDLVLGKIHFVEKKGLLGGKFLKKFDIGSSIKAM